MQNYLCTPHLAGIILLKAEFPPCEHGTNQVRTIRSRHLTVPVQAYNLERIKSLVVIELGSDFHPKYIAAGRG